MSEWMCNSRRHTDFRFGMTYRTDADGYLLDEDGDSRLEPSTYNHIFPGSFLEVVIELENK